VNIGWDHLDASPDAFDRIVGSLPRFADRDAVAKLLGVDSALVGIENVWFIPTRSLTVVYSAAEQQFVVSYGDTVTVRPMIDDPNLANLPLLLDRKRAGERLGAEVDIEILSYLPGERCAVRYTGDGADLIARIAGDEDMPTVDQRQRALFDDPDRRFIMAEPLGVDAAGIRLERAVTGVRAEALIPDVTPSNLLGALHKAIPNLHRASATGLATNGSSEVLQRMTSKTVPRVAAALPHLAARLRAVCAKLEATRPTGGAHVTIHGDLHTANVLFDKSLRPAFIDLDNLAVGDAEFDLALFASRLRLNATLTGTPCLIPPHYIGDDPERFRWYLAATLVGRQMKTCVRHLAPNVAELCETLLTEAEALCR
jgi:Phosphotransferase enzyme family